MRSTSDGPKKLKQIHRAVVGFAFATAVVGQMEGNRSQIGQGRRDMLADEDVLQHGHVVEEADVLEGARDATSQDAVGRQPGD